MNLNMIYKSFFCSFLLTLLFITNIAAQEIDISKGQHLSIEPDFGINVGYSFSSVTFKDVDRTAINQPINTLDATEKFRGNGFHIGVYRKITNTLNIELAFSSFNGNKYRDAYSTTMNKLKGFQVPIMANFLLRDETRSLNFVIGGGLQYLHAKGEEIEYSTTGQKQLSAFSVSTVYLSFDLGVQYRLIQNLYAAYTSRLSVSTNSRYADNGVVSLKYNFGR